MTHTSYDRIGRGYARFRQPDPRISAGLMSALDNARTVVNVGAGSGSYEPTDRVVLAVEPSEEMVKQRSPDAAPCIRAVAERLPLVDQSFDAAMAILTIHHWSDPVAGLRELFRIARRVIVFAYEPAIHSQFWLWQEYFPAAARVRRWPAPHRARATMKEITKTRMRHARGALLKKSIIWNYLGGDMSDAATLAALNEPSAIF